jgi:hypothetical protein
MGITAAVCHLREVLERHFPVPSRSSTRDPRKVREARLYFDVHDHHIAEEFRTRCYLTFNWLLSVDAERLGRCLNPAWLFEVSDALLEVHDSIESPAAESAWAALQSSECFEELILDEWPQYAERRDAHELLESIRLDQHFCLRVVRRAFDPEWLQPFDAVIESEGRRIRCHATSIWLDEER